MTIKKKKKKKTAFKPDDIETSGAISKDATSTSAAEVPSLDSQANTAPNKVDPIVPQVCLSGFRSLYTSVYVNVYHYFIN